MSKNKFKIFKLYIKQVFKKTYFKSRSEEYKINGEIDNRCNY